MKTSIIRRLKALPADGPEDKILAIIRGVMFVIRGNVNRSYSSAFLQL
jgi:hypothetical protein